MKIAVVTGAGRGLGREVAKGLGAKGFSVLAADVDEASASATARAAGAGAWSMQQDVRDPESHRAVARAANQRGSLELWVNNAGVLYTGSAWDHSDEEVQRMAEVNVLGMIWGARAAVEAMRAKGGQIVNIASMSALTPVPGLAVYGATKHAVLGFSISLAGDLDRAAIPIKVSAVCPDAIDTDMVRNIRGAKEAGLAFAAPKLLTVEEVAEVVLEMVDKPKLAVSVPRARGALAHALRPFPALGLQALKPFFWFGDRQRRKANGEG
ncbi:MAG: SDR family NAD(P)-dependent oxidoreductase [Deltaproteobacteria bacterium]|jgi:NAD(P)-dependent dehydrogenase (short-subunit alcohol dehydrogenase family)|nr:SDR family NAD(P)-dependent oxidoreductase [Deltaproteobacteria bacterium]